MEEGLRDIKPIEVPWLTPMQGLFLVLMLLAAVALFYWFKRRGRKSAKDAKTPVEENLSPKEWAYRHLDRLKQETTLAFQVDHEAIRKQFYFSINEILRQYLERQFKIPAAERTTEEILPEIKKLRGHQHLTADQMDGIGRFLRETDLIKFTDQVPKSTDPEQKWQAVWNFVGETSKPREVA